jgi:hypothetical protein
MRDMMEEEKGAGQFSGSDRVALGKFVGRVFFALPPTSVNTVII